MSNLPLGAEFDSNAPWNKKDDIICKECGNIMHINDYGTIKGKIWHSYICIECGNKFSEEPDYG